MGAGEKRLFRRSSTRPGFRHSTARHDAAAPTHTRIPLRLCLHKILNYLRAPSYSPSGPSIRRRDLDFLSACSARAFCLLSSSSGWSRSHQKGFSRSKRVTPMPRHSQESEGPEDASSASGDRFLNRALHLSCCCGCAEVRARRGRGLCVQDSERRGRNSRKREAAQSLTARDTQQRAGPPPTASNKACLPLAFLDIFLSSPRH